MNLEKAAEAFAQKGYKASVFSSGEEASAYLNEQIDGTSVGIGGSKTIEALGLYETLSAHNEVYWHWKAAAGTSPEEATAQAAGAKVYLTSANGVSETGEMVNIDGKGNRISESLYGHEKVYFIIGANKVMPDLQQAIDRARNIAAPKNAQRLSCKTPCAVKADRCYDCSSPGRICNGMVIYFGKMTSCEMEVILIDEALGY
ncbi:MAG: lactate utilization protein [Emergencia sp.]|nr:lactate utilization protein [Emergencia sp.]